MADFRARQKHYLSLLIIATIHWAFKYQALCEVCYVRFMFFLFLFFGCVGSLMVCVGFL